MNFSYLDAQLVPTAEAAVRYFKGRLGIATFKAEEPIAKDVGYRTTLHAKTPDKHWLCVEVASNAYAKALDSFVIQCKNEGLAVMLYVAVARNGADPDFQRNLRMAKANGVGVVEVDENGGNQLCDPLLLSLTGVRSPNLAGLPPRYRGPIHQAHNTFLNGDPVKGCGHVYDEVETLTRLIATRIASRGWWSAGAPKPPKFPKDPWARVTKYIMNNVDRKKDKGLIDLSDALLGSVLGLSSPRNESGHKPKTIEERQRRDRTLRTRFEHGCDVLEQLVKAAKAIKI
jgi:hypothetical protein